MEMVSTTITNLICAQRKAAQKIYLETFSQGGEEQEEIVLKNHYLFKPVAAALKLLFSRFRSIP